MDQTTDELFASLGGSLMKDLFEDLQVGEDDLNDNGWSLEQLEKELAHLEDAEVPPPGLSAAAMVVSHAQEQPERPAVVPSADAWSQSLENFTALSLEQDFLAADTVRKQQKQQQQQELPSFVAEDYDVTEEPKSAALISPPGLAPSRPPGLPSPAAPQKPTVSLKPPPPTPHNSFASDEAEAQAQRESLNRRPPMTPQNSMVAPKARQVQMQQQAQQVQTMMKSQAKQVQILQPPAKQVQMQPQAQQVQMQPQAQQVQMQPQQQQQQRTPMPSQQGPWSMTATQPMQQQKRLYCHSHPSAPPIPATAMESSMMKARDIAYVIHSMLKQVLLMGTSMEDYHVLLLKRQTMGAPIMMTPANTPRKAEEKEEESQDTLKTMSLKSKEWMEKHSTLGHLSRSDITRPRALIATNTLVKEEATEGKKLRATLWKARLYVDQAYQAFFQICHYLELSGGKITPDLQPHLRRLYKYLGIVQKDSVYQVDETVVTLIHKLNKGRILVARVLEHALLPPMAAQALLAQAISQQLQQDGPDRFFIVMTRIVSNMPQLDPAKEIQMLQAFVEHFQKTLASRARMAAVHTLLQRPVQDPEHAAKWKELEQEFSAKVTERMK